MQTAQAIVYTMPVCPNCRSVKESLRNNGISFVEKDLEDTEVQTELLFRGIVPTVAPLVEIDGRMLSPAEIRAMSSPAQVMHE